MNRFKSVPLLIATACLLMVLLCGLGALAMGRGTIAPPAFHLYVGALGIEAGLSHKPECPPHCEWQEPTSGQRVYSVWFVATTSDAEGEHKRARLLYAQPMR